jgi:hypothetical protein
MISQCTSEDAGKEHCNPLENLTIKEAHHPKEYSGSKKQYRINE